MKWAWCLLLGILVTAACGESEEEPLPIAELEVVLEVQSAPGVTGFLHSYAVELQRCPEPLSWWQRLVLVPSAYASHPLDLTANDIIVWHAPLSLSDSERFEKTQTVEKGKLCGLSWLFAHGGVLHEGELASLRIVKDDEALVSTHYASELELTFSEPLDFQEDGQIVLRLDVAAWVASFEDADSDALAARDAWLNLGAAVEVER